MKAIFLSTKKVPGSSIGIFFLKSNYSKMSAKLVKPDIILHLFVISRTNYKEGIEGGEIE